MLQDISALGISVRSAYTTTTSKKLATAVLKTDEDDKVLEVLNKMPLAALDSEEALATAVTETETETEMASAATDIDIDVDVDDDSADDNDVDDDGDTEVEMPREAEIPGVKRSDRR
jgi:hypothetical protein